MIFHHVTVFLSPALYLDPGTGSLLVQILLAVLLGVGVIVRIFWSRIKGLFGVKPSSSMNPGEDEDGE